MLSHFPSNYAAEVIAGLGPENQLEVIRRVAMIGRTSPEAVSELEFGLEMRLSSMVNQKHSNAGGVESVAEILNVCERSIERSIMESIGREDPELSEEIRRLMFVFEDISKLSDRDIQSLLKNVETAQWAMSLKGASDVLQEKIMRNMIRVLPRICERKWSTLAVFESVKWKRSSRKLLMWCDSWKTAVRYHDPPVTKKNTSTSHCVSIPERLRMECDRHFRNALP